MPSDHRGRTLFGNYRPTPRLAQLVSARHMAEYRTGVNALQTSPELAQELLDEYRERRDLGDRTPETDASLAQEQQYLKSTIKNRPLYKGDM